MSSVATFCDVPISTAFDGHAATSCVSLAWVINSGLRTRNSQASGVLTLPCNTGVISMVLNNIPVAASPASDLLLGLDWLDFATSLAPELAVYLDSGVSLDLRRTTLSTSAIVSGVSPSTATLTVVPVSRGSASVDSSSSPSTTLGGPGAVSTPSSMPCPQGVGVVGFVRLSPYMAINCGLFVNRLQGMYATKLEIPLQFRIESSQARGNLLGVVEIDIKLGELNLNVWEHGKFMVLSNVSMSVIGQM
ncbi:hypothetical protein FB451DRAFT_1361446 [Mycena latifolia]|nr:hypothetical protein FB451DRAFT_1361446 [Mycena latifolia]